MESWCELDLNSQPLNSIQTIQTIQTIQMSYQNMTNLYSEPSLHSYSNFM